VEWENPREVHEVRAVFPAERAPSLEALHLEWWGSIWPRYGSGGWMRLDDPWNGRWVAVPGKVAPGKEPGVVVFTIPPLTRREWEKAPESGGPSFRRTLKIRVVGALPESLRILGGSRWRLASFDLDFRFLEDGEREGRLEVSNGVIQKIESLPPPREVAVSGTGWKARGRAGGSAGVRMRILHAENGDLASNDLTRMTIRLGASPESSGFSFIPQDVLREGALRLRDLGVLVSESARGLSHASDPGPSGKYWPRSVRRRIRERPEMTLKTALEGIPRLSPPRWVPLGAPSARQEVVVGPLGDWSMWKASLHTPGRESGRIPHRGEKLDAILDTRAEPLFDGGDREGAVRYLHEGHLPLIHVEWRTGRIRYNHALLATILLGEPGDDESRRGDETVVLLSKLEMANPSSTSRKAAVNLRYSHDAPLFLDARGIIAIRQAGAPRGEEEGELTALRGQISLGRPSGGGAGGFRIRPGGQPGTSAVLRFEATLEPGGKQVIYFKAPFVDLLDARELERLKEISYEEEAPRVLEYWRKRLERGMVIDVPCPALNNFYRANLWHNVITTDRDPRTGLYNQGVATFRYRVFGNETIMVARSLDLRGEHREAERYIEPFLHFQGEEALTGRFSAKKGAFHSAGAYTHGQYAMNHGFVMWGVADHYLITRDRDYLTRVAPNLLEACDFLITQRRSTRGPCRGLSPASSLEDVIEFQYWFATNGYFSLGLKRAGQALAAAGHPQAGRITREAELYRRDIERAAREAATRAAAVQLRDGSWIPYVPSRMFQWRHLTEGWIREALYCSLHLATTEVIPPEDPLITWMLDELEDNTFFSAQSGYNVQDVDSRWFSRGAVTLQPCLLDTPVVYMARDEIQAALRSFWNTYALLIYPDVHCFAEWARSFGVAGGPVYKTSDESRFVLWLRQLLVWEDGDRLWLCRGAPREWLEDGKEIRVERAATLFGEVNLLIRSRADRGRIQASILLPSRNPPRQVWLRLRHPRGLHPARVYLGDGSRLDPARVIGEDILLVPGEGGGNQMLDLTAEYEL